MLAGRQQEIHTERDQKLEKARKQPQVRGSRLREEQRDPVHRAAEALHNSKEDPIVRNEASQPATCASDNITQRKATPRRVCLLVNGSAIGTVLFVF